MMPCGLGDQWLPISIWLYKKRPSVDGRWKKLPDQEGVKRIGLIRQEAVERQLESLGGGEIGIGFHPVFPDIKTLGFLLIGNPDPTEDGGDNRPGEQRGEDGEHREGEHANDLNAELAEAMAREQSFVHIEQADGQGSPDATGAMH